MWRSRPCGGRPECLPSPSLTLGITRIRRHYNYAHGQRRLPLRTNRSVLRPGREEPYLCIQDVIIFVRYLEVSLRFYVDKLGLELTADRRLPADDADRGIHPFGGWIEVAPPDGSANLTLVAVRPDQPEYKLIGGNC